MTVHPDDIGIYQEEILGRVKDVVNNADRTEFRGWVGHTFDGSRDYKQAYEYSARVRDEFYDVFLLVQVRKEAQ